MKMIFLFGLFVCMSNAFPQATDSLTIEQVVDQVIQRHPLVQQALEEVNAAGARVEAAKSSYYPTGDAELFYTRLGPASEINFPGLGLFQLFPRDNYDAHIGLRQTVYDFGKTSASVDVNRSKIQTAKDNVHLVKTNLAFQSIQTAYAILYLRQSLRVKDEQIGVLNEHLQITKRKVESGTSTDFDTLTTRVRVAAAQTQRVDILNELTKQEANMRRLLGLPVAAEVRLRGEFIQRSMGLNIDSLTTVAIRQRRELAQAKDVEQTMELQSKVVSLQDKPSLAVNLIYGLKNGYFPDMDVFRGNWVAGVEAKVPIFDGFKTRNEEEEANANLRGAHSHVQDFEQMIRTEVEQSVSDVRSNAEKLLTSRLQVEEAEQAVAMARVRYESGVITNLDLTDAETSLEEARLANLRTLFQYVVSTYALERSVGENFAGSKLLQDPD
jgi:outer membrane protein